MARFEILERYKSDEIQFVYFIQIFANKKNELH